jgi:hypothetical protein
VATDTRTDEQLRSEIAERREALAGSMAALRREVDRVRPGHLLEGRLPLLAAAAGLLGFLRAGGVDAVFRLFAARRRHERERREAWWSNLFS